MPDFRQGWPSSTAVRGRWISALEVIAASLVVLGHSVWGVLPNSVAILVVMALISFRLREGSWRAIGLTLPKPLLRTLLFALGAALIQQAIGQLVVDPLTQPFLHYSREANPMEGGHNISSLLTWLGVIWTYAAFGEEISFRGYLLNRVADIGNRSTAAFIIGLLWSSIMFGFAHWYQGWAGVISASASGLVFGSAYLLSGRNLWVSILAHGLSDTLALILTGLG